MRTMRRGREEHSYYDMDSGHKIVLQTMKLAKDCYQIKMELMNGRITVDKAVKIIQSRKTKSIEEDLLLYPYFEELPSYHCPLIPNGILWVSSNGILFVQAFPVTGSDLYVSIITAF